MKANQLFNKILYKWPAKVICLIIAICLYLFHQASLTEKRSFVIPLTLIEEGEVIHNGDYTSNVTVTIRANTEQISTINSRQLNAYVNLNGISKKGEYNLPVKVRVADEIMAFDPFEIRVKPEYIKLQVESKDIKYVPIEPMITGEPAHGYEITSYSVNPAVAEITGPQTMIENTKKIYIEKVDITGMAKKEVFDAQYRPLNKLLTINEKDPVEVTVVIEPMHMERVFEDIEIAINNLNSTLFIEGETPVVSFMLQGTVPVLENYTPGKRFVTADLSKITEEGEYEIPLKYNIPSYLVLSEDAPQSFVFTLSRHPEESSEGETEVNE